MPMNSLIKVTSMKKNHGNIILFSMLFVFSMLLNAGENKYCSYTLSSSKTEGLVVNEPITVTFKVRQKFHSEVMFFDFKVVNSDAYKVVSIEEKRHEFNYHDAKKEFTFLLLPKKVGKIDIKFSFDIRRASDEAVKQAYVGSRDNVKSIPTIKVHIADPLLSLDVKNLQKPVDAVGEFTLNMKLSSNHSNSYDAINVVYTLIGRGYLDESYEPLTSIDKASLFKGIKETPVKITRDGYEYQKTWSYAIVKEESFSIPSVVLRIYNYKTNRYDEKSTQEEKISITKLNIEDMLDDEEAPTTTLEYKKYLIYFYNLLIFIAGFLVAKLLEYLPKKSTKKEHCCKDLLLAKTAKEILLIAMKFNKNGNLDQEIRELEEIIYKDRASKELSSLKKSLLKKIESSI